ncbi:MAG: hypothetical protein KJ066_16105 [Acidobacteria bacterium]|nr:hypothetical protein [Acidobacteriota bacterium]
MTMRVTFNTAFRNGIRDINRAAEEMIKRQREVSSQRRVHVPSDDPSAASAIVGERNQMRGVDQYVSTSNSVESRLRVVDTILSDVIKNLTAAQTTAAAGRSTVLSATQRQALALEVRGIRDALLADVNAEYGGSHLFSGTRTTTAPFTRDGAGTIGPYAGNAEAARLDIDRSREVEVTFDGGALVGDLFDSLDTLAAAIEAGDMPAIDAGMERLNEAFDRATRLQSRVGNTLGDLDDHRARLDQMKRASDVRRSQLEDANLVESISAMQQAETAHRAALGAFSNAARLSLLDYLR